MSQLGITEHKIAGVPTIRLFGRLDFDTAPGLRKTLLKHVDREGRRLILDLESLQYMDTTGLATLIEAQSRLRKHGGRLVLFGLCSQVRDLLSMNQAERIFRIVADEEEAAELVAGPSR